MAIEIRADNWAMIKAFVTGREASLQYFEKTKNYDLIAFDGLIAMTFSMTKYPQDSTDLNDFVNNFKATANQKIGSLNYTLEKRLRVDNEAGTGGIIGPIPVSSKKMRYKDMNQTTGGIARNTKLQTSDGWKNLYYREGKGVLYGFMINLENADGWYFNLEIDGEKIFGTNGMQIEDVIDTKIYKLNKEFSHAAGFGIGLNWKTNAIFWQAPLLYPIYYDQSVVVKVFHNGSDKKFQAGLIVLTEE